MTRQDVLADPFAGPSDLTPTWDPEAITAGRYRLPDLQIHEYADGSRSLETGLEAKTGGWQRVTTLVKAIADARALDLWHQRELIKGLVLREDLYDLACSIMSRVTDPAELKQELQALASAILSAAGSDVGRNLGTAFHGFTDAQDAGGASFARRRWHGKLSSYRQGLLEQGLEAVPEYIERRVVVLRYNLAGTLDRIFWDRVAGVHRVGDAKTQKTFWTWTEIAAQQAAYAMADAMWDRQTRRYVEMPKVAQDHAVIVWCPEEHPDREDGVDFFDVCLERGRERLDLCHQVDQIRKADRSKFQTLGLLRPAAGLSAVEAYATRLDAVGSLEEGSALWSEITARQLHETPELLELARDVATRFTPSQLQS